MKTKTRTVKVGQEQFTVREITVADLLELFRDEEGPEILARAALGDLAARAKLMAIVHGLSEEDLRQMGAGAFMVLDEAFRELNSDFFGRLVPALEEAIRTPRKRPEGNSSGQ